MDAKNWIKPNPPPQNKNARWVPRSWHGSIYENKMKMSEKISNTHELVLGCNLKSDKICENDSQ